MDAGVPKFKFNWLSRIRDAWRRFRARRIRASYYRAQVMGPIRGCPAPLIRAALQVSGQTVIRLTDESRTMRPEWIDSLGIALRYPVDSQGKSISVGWRVVARTSPTAQPGKAVRYLLEARLPEDRWRPVALIRVRERLESAE